MRQNVRRNASCINRRLSEDRYFLLVRVVGYSFIGVLGRVDCNGHFANLL